jgi:hypothetical protein
MISAAVALTAGTGLLAAGPALASGGLEPGNLILEPASGAVSLAPTFATKDGCPTGYQGSAQVSIFGSNGTLLSRISVVVPFPAKAFHGALEGKMGAILQFAGVKSGGALQFAVGCYTGPGGTGNVKWDQYMVVNLSADGKSYSTGVGNPSNGQSASGSATGQSTSGSAATKPALANLYGQVASANYPNPAGSSGGSGSRVEAALIAGLCGLAVAGAGIFFYRRRQNSQASDVQASNTQAP